MKERIGSPELMEAARQALARQDAEKAKLAAMTPEERKIYIAAWAKRLAAESVEMGERGTGCACCDPDVKAKLKRTE
jgi:acyl-CoA reductase-like NAD-dependent aldehyde dehydrogenase